MGELGHPHEKRYKKLMRAEPRRPSGPSHAGSRAFHARHRALGTLGLSLLACTAAPGSGRQLGDDLGTFHATATSLDNTCGPNALDSPERFEFDVELSMDGIELFWDNRVGGRVRSTLEFSLSSDVEVPLRPAGREPGCTVVRTDDVTGTFAVNASGEIVSFTGVLGYAFANAAGSECTVDDLLAQGLTRLPCALDYTVRGERTRAPEAPP